MTFGFQVMSDSDSVQISSDLASYSCIYSGLHSGGAEILGWDYRDVVATTYTGGADGGVAGSTVNGAVSSRLTLFGEHRVLVFRPSNLVSVPHEFFGIEVYSEDSELTFTSSLYPLLISDSPSYAAEVFQGHKIQHMQTGTVLRMFLFVRWVTINGLSGQARYFYGTIPGVSSLDAGSYATSTIIDVSNIPIYYSTGDVSIAAFTPLPAIKA